MLKAFLYSYSQIFFSKSKLVAIFFLLATLIVDPLQGSLGALSVFLTYFAFQVFPAGDEFLSEGLLTFNALLIGLAIGHYLGFSILSLGLLLLSIPTNLFLTVTLKTYFGNVLGLPYLSLPFVFVTWILLAVGVIMNYPLNHAESHLFLKVLDEKTPILLKIFFINVGTLFFKPNVLSGIFVFIGMLIASRMATLFAIFGLFVGITTYIALGFSPAALEKEILGFNYMLTMVSLSGIFLIPTLRAVEIGIVATLLTALITPAIKLFTYGLPPLAAPFNFVTLIVLYSLKWAKTQEIPEIYLTGLGETSLPEINLKRDLNRIHTITAPHRNRYTLPFFGKWLVWQGNNGKYTHQGDYRYAYDFVATDGKGKTFKDYGLNLEDYYTFGLPVRAPAPGKVVRVIDHVPDNKPPLINPHDNWGNVVIIEHGYGEFTEISHFMENGIVVKEGDLVSRGALLGYAGNSGRSPEPHIHLQLQSTANIGAPTRPLYISSYVKVKDGQEELVDFGIPQEGEFVRTLEETPHVREFFPFLPGNYWDIELRGFKNKKVRWIVKKEQGNLWIEEDGYRIFIEEDPGLYRAIIREHPEKPVALYLFFLGFELMPLELNFSLFWQIKEPPAVFLKWPWNWLDVYTGIIKPPGFHKLKAIGRYKSLKAQALFVQVDFMLERSFPKETIKLQKEIVLGHNTGIVSMVIRKEEKELFRLKTTEFGKL